MTLNRRNLIKLGAAAGTAACGVLPSGTRAAASPSPSSAPAPFSVPLSVPPLLRPVRRTPTADHYEVTVQEATAEILPGVDTPVLTYGGSFPGPTIRALRGRETAIRYTNALSLPIATHLHGGHVPADQDGYPMDTIEPGASREYRYVNSQPAATLWYHDHAHMSEAESVYRGLAGAYLV
ncbi:multicopper oxidase domain-containing protein, partial [Streptomyces sp. SID11233]|nr:multicopper oxidase domain-containing protein [Streptomyces sp. SID11233]